MYHYKVLFLTPTLDASVCHDYTRSMFRTAEVLKEHGIGSDLLFLSGCAAMDRARDTLLNAFLQSDATHCLQIDADLGWSAEDIVKMLNHDVDFVAGVYPVKDDEPEFRVNFIDKRLPGLIGADGVPGGFCLITRDAVEMMVEKHTPLRARDITGNEEITWLHTHEVSEGRIWGEDMVFCRRAREAGVQIWVDPTINLRHWSGTKCYDHKLIGNLVRAA